MHLFSIWRSSLSHTPVMYSSNLPMHSSNSSTFIQCICIHAVGRGACMHAMVCIWKSEDNAQELVFAIYCVGSWDWTQGFEFGNKCLYPLYHHLSLTGALLHWVIPSCLLLIAPHTHFLKAASQGTHNPYLGNRLCFWGSQVLSLRVGTRHE